MKHAAGNRQVLSFGARRMHPALSTLVDRNAFIGGADGVPKIYQMLRTKARVIGDAIHEGWLVANQL